MHLQYLVFGFVWTCSALNANPVFPRQGQDCDADHASCGTGCIGLDAHCCPGNVYCNGGYYCQLNPDTDDIACCPDGAQCEGNYVSAISLNGTSISSSVMMSTAASTATGMSTSGTTLATSSASASKSTSTSASSSGSGMTSSTTASASTTTSHSGASHTGLVDLPLLGLLVGALLV